MLSPQGPYGRVIEIVGADDDTALVIAALAQRLGALPWRTAGPASVLQRLRSLPLDEQAHVAMLEGARPSAGDLSFLDVAACLAGVTPAWTGGPLTHLWSARESLTAEFDEADRAVWSVLEAPLRQAFE